MSFPVFASGDVLNASDMNGVGLWLVKSQTIGTGVSSVVVTGAFSADYDNYRITYTGGVGSGVSFLQLQFGATVTGYYNQLIYAPFASTTVSANVNDNNASSARYVGGGTSTFAKLSTDVFSPFLATRTFWGGSYVDGSNSGTANGYVDNNLSYTGFTMSVSSPQTITGGTIRVYGYRN
jgi:hypothetical protein